MTEYKYENKKDFCDSISISPSDFDEVLNYYNIPIKKNSILCPFHSDKHYGSCFINRNKTSATCYVCPPNGKYGKGKYFSAVDLVMHYENLGYL